MNMLVDSHCHLDQLDLSLFQGQLKAVLEAAELNGIKHMLSVGLTPDQSRRVIELTEIYPHVSGSVGVHPTEIIEKEISEQDLIHLGDHPKIVAIGETGLDFYRTVEKSGQTLQVKRFRCHIRAAIDLNKPLIIHTRQAREETIKILTEENAQRVGGVMHCFTEDWEMAQKAINLNFYISFSGIITFKNAVDIQALVKKVPLERILIETDAPYLAPVPHRGKPNFPAYVVYVAEKIAELKACSFEEIAAATTRNFFDCFKLADRSRYVDAR